MPDFAKSHTSFFFLTFLYFLLIFPADFNRVDKKELQTRGGSRGRVQGVRTPPLEMTCGFLIQLVFCQKKTMWFIGVEVKQETIAPPPKKNPGSAPADQELLGKN